MEFDYNKILKIAEQWPEFTPPEEEEEGRKKQVIYVEKEEETPGKK